MRFYYIPSRRLVAAWSPKCACSSLVKWLHQLLSKEDSSIPSMSSMDPRKYLGINGYEFSNMINALPLLSEPNTHLMVLTRDPVSRMRSSYINKFLRYTNNDLTKVLSLEPFAWRFLKQVADSKGHSVLIEKEQLRINKDNTFDLSLAAFLAIVGKGEHKKRIYDHHFMPQLCTESELKILQRLERASSHVSVIKTEAFDTSLNSINEKLGVTYKPGFANETSFDADWKLSDDPSVMLLSNRELISLKVVPSKNCVRKYCKENNLMKAFKFDFLHFNYKL